MAASASMSHTPTIQRRFPCRSLPASCCSARESWATRGPARCAADAPEAHPKPGDVRDPASTQRGCDPNVGAFRAPVSARDEDRPARRTPEFPLRSSRMGGKDPRRQPRLRPLRRRPQAGSGSSGAGHAAARRPSHRGLIRKLGELELVDPSPKHRRYAQAEQGGLEFAVEALRCTGCGERGADHRMVRLCDPGCPRQRG